MIISCLLPLQGVELERIFMHSWIFHGGYVSLVDGLNNGCLIIQLVIR